MKISFQISRFSLCLLVLCVIATGAGAQKNISSFRIDHSGLPLPVKRTMSLSVNEGSFMNLDVSPDGTTILFDLLGDIYSLPIRGGVAKQLTRGLALNTYPVFSPDGKYIAYCSDASGDNQLHVAEILTGRTKRITSNPPTIGTSVAFEPVWGAGCRTLETRDAIYPISGGQLKKDVKRRQIGITRDNRYCFYVSEIGDSNVVIKKSLTTDNVDTIIRLYKWSDLNIRVSPDGNWLTYMTGGGLGDYHLQGLYALHIPTKNGKQILTFELPLTGYLPSTRYCFTPDSKYVLIWHKGKIRKITLETGSNSEIAFRANAKIDMASLNRHEFILNQSFDVKYCRSVQLRADGKQLLFSALGKIYVREMPGGKPRLLVPQQSQSQFTPSYSPDGKWVAYVTWSDSLGGQLWRVPADGGNAEQVSEIAGLYMHPSWSPDMKHIAVTMKKPVLGVRNNNGLGAMQVINVNTHTVKMLADSVNMMNDPVFSKDGSTLYYRAKQLFLNTLKPDPMQLYPQLVASSLVTGRLDTIAVCGEVVAGKIHQIRQTVISPDRKHIVFTYNENLYLSNAPGDKTPVLLYDTIRVLPVIRFAEGGIDPAWNATADTISWSYGGKFFRVALSKIYRSADSLALRGNSSQPMRTIITSIVKPDEIISIGLSTKDVTNEGLLAFTNARLITMNGKQIIEEGTVVISNGRIVQVGSTKQMSIPTAAKVYDMRGKTIIPGLIDMHSHMYFVPPDVFPQQSWEFVSNLAFGITTARDPSGSFDTFGYSELLRTGQMTGPRLFTVSDAVRMDNNPLTNVYQAQAVVRNRQLMGGYDIKQYRQRTRNGRQLLRLGCENVGLNMTNERQQDPLGFIGMIKDGSTGVEHNPQFSNARADMVQFISKSGTYLTPTLFVGSEQHPGQHYFHKYYRAHPDARYEFFSPPITRIREIYNDTVFNYSPPDFLYLSKIDSAIFRNGGNIVVGSHGEEQAITMHFEMWALQMGGMTNHEVLQAATINGAKALGMEKDLGSITKGKIGDLVILDNNPLIDIHNSTSIRYVVKEGVLYDGATMNRLWPVFEELHNKGLTKGISHDTLE